MSLIRDKEYHFLKGKDNTCSDFFFQVWEQKIPVTVMPKFGKFKHIFYKLQLKIIFIQFYIHVSIKIFLVHFKYVYMLSAADILGVFKKEIGKNIFCWERSVYWTQTKKEKQKC